MPVPFSPRFDILDWNIRADETTAWADDKLLSDSIEEIDQYAFIPYPSVITEDGFTSLVADAQSNSLSTVIKSVLQISDHLPAAVPETYTFEFDIYLSGTSLPLGFSSPDDRIFIGAINQQGYTAGFLFSYEGVALAAYPEDPSFTVLAGSKDLIFDDTGAPIQGINIRAIIDGDLGRIAVYLASTDSAYATNPYDTDAELKYSLAAKPSTGAFNDSVYLQASASTGLKLGLSSSEGNEAILTIGSLRLASSKVLPTDRPVADAYSSNQVVLGNALSLFGSKSYDPTGKSLTYNWELDVYPEGSRAAIQGASYSTADILVAGDSVVVLTGKVPSKMVDDTTVVIEEGPPGSLLDLAWDGVTRTLTVTLGMDATGNAVTTSGNLVQAFSNPLASGYNIEISGGTTSHLFHYDSATQVTTAEQITYPGLFRGDLAILGSSGMEILEPGSFSFSGGAGSTMMNPIFVADKPGVYVASLVVNNGVRDSFPGKVVFSVGITNQLLSHRPNSTYIWRYLSDFWKLVPDKEQITSMWSAITQAVSSDLVTAWQHDYAKALKDVSRRYQRRWLHYDTHIDVPAGYTAYVVQPDIVSRQDIFVAESGSLNATNTATTLASSMAPFSVGKALLRTTLHPPTVVDISSIEEQLGSSSWVVKTSTDAFPIFEVLAERTGGYFVADPDILVQQTPARSTVLSDPTYPVSARADISRDTIRVYDEQEKNPQIVKIDELNPALMENAIRLEEGSSDGEIPLQVVDGFARKWDHLRDVKNSNLEQTPYIYFGDDLDLSDYVLSLGDYLVISVVDPYTSSEVSVSLPILAAGVQCVFVDWFPLLTALTMQAEISGDSLDWTEELLVDVDIVPKALVLAKTLAKLDDLVSIPSLGTTSIISDLRENLDYRIIDNTVTITNWFTGTVRSDGSDRVYPDTPLVTHQSLTSAYQKAGSLYFIGQDTSLSIDTICIGSGDSSVYKVISYNDDGSMTLDRKLEHTADKLYFWAPRYSAYDPCPTEFWAEVSYLDNWKTIENNFGLFIGFPKELVDAHDESLDYLSVTKAVWFAFMSGPHFDNMQLAVQAMFDLPYAEANGQIKSIDEPTEFQEGRIILEDESGRQHTYLYPKNADIATNPATGNTYQALPSPLYWELELIDGVYYQTVDGNVEVVPDDVVAVMADATVTAYSKLVDVVKIDDYISDPDLVARQFGGNVVTYVDELGNTHVVDSEPTLVEKYHKFIVEVPMGTTQTTQVFPLIKSFLNQAKPAYTDFILVGSLKLSDEISVLDTTILKPTLLLKDTPHTSPFWAMASSPIPEEREDLIWPKEKTLEKMYSIDYSALLSAGIRHTPPGYSLAGTWPGVTQIIWGQDIGMSGSFVYGVREDHVAHNLPFWNMSLNFTSIGATIMDYSAGTSIGGGFRSLGFFLDGLFYMCDRINEANAYWSGGLGAPVWIKEGLDFSDLAAPVAPVLGPPIPQWSVVKDSVDTFYLFNAKIVDLFASGALVPEITYYDKEDVLEKYESGYCEGVLDDYSGDGSWNFNRSALDMVNTVNSDIDVLRSRLWVPVTKDTAGLQAGIEFEFGEPVDIYSNGSPVTLPSGDPPIWDEAPPVVLHIGSGVHPKIPSYNPASAGDGTYSPQSAHPNTFLLLGFDRSDTDDFHDWDNPPTTATEDYNAYGDETRLDVIETVHNDVGGTLTLVGRRSGAIAEIVAPNDGSAVMSRSNSAHVAMPGSTGEFPHFLLETIWQQDKLLEYGPTSDPTLFLTKYIPMDSGAAPYPNSTGGISLDDWWSATPSFDSAWSKTSALFGGIIDGISVAGATVTITTLHDHHLTAGPPADTVYIWNTDQPVSPGSEKLLGEYEVTGTPALNEFEISVGFVTENGTFGYLGHSPTYYQKAEVLQKELQQFPYHQATAENEQFIPSTSPGVYSQWAVAPAKLLWDYEDEGQLVGAGATDIDDFTVSTAVHALGYLQNVHYGLKIRTRKEYHLTHGFTEFFIPPPTIKLISALSSGADIRICGFYFCNDDPTRVAIPTDDPDSYGTPASGAGIIGGSWVFFRNVTSGVEYPVSGYLFETGSNPGFIVGFLGKNRIGVSTFIYGGPEQPSDGHILEVNVPVLVDGYYDIIVRNYRPYRMKVGGDWVYHMDEDIAPMSFHYSVDEYGTIGWGIGTFGGA